MKKSPSHLLSRLFAHDASHHAVPLQRFAKAAAKELNQNPQAGRIIVMFDVDRFAALKSRYGSARGEQLLAELTAVLAQHHPKAQPLAYFEDKFLLLLPDTGDYLAHLQNGLADAVQSMGLEKYVGMVRFSFGVYQIKNAQEPIEDIIEKVRIAHKTAGKNPHKAVVFYDDALVQAIAQENYYNEHLQDGLAKGEFKMYLQRQMMFAQPDMLRAKALVRWATPNGRIVYPDSFIPQFEQNGLMTHLDFFMVEEACRHLQQMRKGGKPELTISVNISPITLFQPDFIARFLGFVAQYEVPVERLVLEIQKSYLLEDDPTAMAKLTQLHEMGFPLAAEVVTAGQSNLCLLASLPVQYLKIDRKFIRAIDANPNITLVLGGIIEMAHKLSTQVVCEGVEHRADLELLESLGCDIAQGYYLMKAVPKEEFLHPL